MQNRKRRMQDMKEGRQNMKGEALEESVPFEGGG
jgi:hypothetical protein